MRLLKVYQNPTFKTSCRTFHMKPKQLVLVFNEELFIDDLNNNSLPELVGEGMGLFYRINNHHKLIGRGVSHLYIYLMDIFNAQKRSKEDSIKKPLNYPEAQITEKKIREDHEREIQRFNNFLKNLYMKFSFKVNKCKYNCISEARNYRQIGECEAKCGQGVQNFHRYTDQRISEMQQLLGDCIANASTLHNSIDEIYYCYEMYNNGFKKLKEFITEESLFYQ